MSTAAPFTIAMIWYICAVEYNSAIKRTNMLLVATRMKLENILLTNLLIEKYHTFPLVYAS